MTESGLVVVDKRRRVANFHHSTIRHFFDLLGAAGCDHPSKLEPGMVHRRMGDNRVSSFSELYGTVEPGALLTDRIPERYAEPWRRARADTF